jgi:hypothetical protein
MRLSKLFLAVVLLTSSFAFTQHSSGGGSSSGSSGGGSSSSSSSGGSHGGYSGGPSYSGGSSGSSHGSGAGYGSSGGSGHTTAGGHSSSGENSSGSTHSSGGGHVSRSSPISNASASHGKPEHGAKLVSSSHSGIENSPSTMPRPVREPKSALSERAVVPEKRGFFSFLRHPFRKPEPKGVEVKHALYLPRPICPKGRCAPACPVGQVRSGGACTTPVIPVCTGGMTWNTGACGYSRYHCSLGEFWNGTSCAYGASFLDSCIALRMSLDRQAQRVQNAEAARQRACATGPSSECSGASASWQSEENLRQSLLSRYQQCRMQSFPMYSAQHGWPYDSVLWFDSLQFNADF